MGLWCVDADQVSVRRLTVPLALCLVAFGLRLGPLWPNRFHSDEALYATWALGIASGGDVLLAGVAPDKPPLLFIRCSGVPGSGTNRSRRAGWPG